MRLLVLRRLVYFHTRLVKILSQDVQWLKIDFVALSSTICYDVYP